MSFQIFEFIMMNYGDDAVLVKGMKGSITLTVDRVNSERGI